MAALNEPPHEALPAAEVRARMAAQPRKPGPDVAKVEDRSIPGDPSTIPVRLYTPLGDGPFPVMVWYHGGGWVIGSIETNDATCRSVANEAGCIVASVEYRLAPETKFPGAVEDAYTAAVWAAANAASFDGDPLRISVGGASAGGNLAAAVALMARDKGTPALVHQLLVYPIADLAMDTESYRENGEGFGLTSATMHWYAEQYIRGDQDRTNPFAAPLRADDHSGLPPALVITAECDPLRDEGEAYAERLSEAGVPTRCTRYDGMIHGFFNSSIGFDKTWQAIDEVGRELRAAFGIAQHPTL